MTVINDLQTDFWEVSIDVRTLLNVFPVALELSMIGI